MLLANVEFSDFTQPHKWIILTLDGKINNIQPFSTNDRRALDIKKLI